MSKTKDRLHSQTERHRRAAEAAEEATEWPDAVREYEACLSLVAQTPSVDGLDEAALLTALGRCYWNLSDARTAWRTLRRAISIYQQRVDGVGQARATVEILRIWGPPERQRLMAEDALQRLGDADPYLRALLLLDLGWRDEGTNEKYGQAMELAERHGFEDILTSRVQRQAWQSMDEGRIEDGVAMLQEAHETYARLRIFHVAAGTLRGAGFNLLEVGQLDDGFGLAQRSFEYASSVNLLFQAELALMDMIGVLFARGDFERCDELLAQSPARSDFRGDLFRMWMAEARGDTDGALRLMVSPERSGNVPTAMAQIHAAGAGVLFRTGKSSAAAEAMQAWAAVERTGDEFDLTEVPAFLECLLAVGDDELVRSIYDACKTRDRRSSPARFSTLQGRSLAPARAGICARLGLLDEAARHYSEGLSWCERERCTRDAELCGRGLAELRARREVTPAGNGLP